ncbi:MAG: hypothetical protein FJ271_09195 [Planctomycetes bacterium]|nr:hypothetical protein [Planctomycetota bacterium]
MNNSSGSVPIRKHSSGVVRSSRPEKPFKGFPLFAHPSGQWARKIRGRLVYFGSWRTDRSGTAALESHNREWPYLKEGKTPPAVDVGNGCTMKQLVNAFLALKESKMEAGELSPRSYRDYFLTCEILIDQFSRERLVSDLRHDDFRQFRSQLAKRYNVVSLRNCINRICIIFNFAHEAGLIDKPMTFGGCFDRPSALSLRRERNARGARLFTRDECIAILEAADVQQKAMVLLALNCGYGNTDVANLRESHFKPGGWVEFPRVKTEIPRRCPLWPETLEAVNAWLPLRPRPANPEARGLVFLTAKQGRAWVRVQPRKRTPDDDTDDDKGPQDIPLDALSQAFAKLLRKLGINGRRGFYCFRHCVETIGGESRDQVAVDAIMGHVDSSMSANYRHAISDDRLRAVVNVIHDWLWSKPTTTNDTGATKGGAR